jgi:ATP-dependent Clp protease ATP-binding subunit ClpA
MANQSITTYTEQGQQVLDLAKEEALSFNHYYIGAEHLLLGILREGSAAAPLTEQGVTLEHVRAGLLFLIGRDRGNPDPGTPFTPEAQQILARAGTEAQAHGETAINPHHILYALEHTGRGPAIGGAAILQSLGIKRQKEKKQVVEEAENERTLRLMEQRIAQHPPLSPEEEQQLSHLIARAETEKIRADRLKETPDRQIVEEGEAAYFRLIYASQHLVLSVAKEYLEPGRDLRELINVGNIALTLAITRFGMKTQVPLRSYVTHWLHLEMMETLD